MHKYRMEESNFNKKIFPSQTPLLQLPYYHIISMSSAADRKARLEQQIADRRREEEERIQRETAELAELEELARIEEEERLRAEIESRRLEEELRRRERQLRERLSEDARKKTEEARKKAEASTIVVRHSGRESGSYHTVSNGLAHPLDPS